MKVKIQGIRRIIIKSDIIKLDALLKYASIVSTGGEAKHVIQSGEVLVNKEVCTTRGKKIKPGDIVHCGGDTILVKQAEV